MIRQESERGVRADAAVQPAGDAAQAEEIAARNIRNLVLQTALAGVVNGGIGTFLAVYLTRLGASPLALSLLTALPALLTIAVALPAGAIAARYTQPVRQSTRHFLLIRLCYLLVAAAAFLPAEAAIWTVVVIWTLTAIPGAIANTAWMDVFAEAIPARERARINGLRWGLLGFITACSVALFGQMLDRLPFPLSYQLVFLISFVAGLLNVWFYSRLIVPAQPIRSQGGATVPWRGRILEALCPLREGGPFLRFTIGSSLLRAGMFLAAGLYSIYWVRDLQATDSLIGLRTTAGNAALVVSYPLWGWAATRLGHERALVLATVGLGLYPVMTGLTTAAPWLVPAAILWGLFAGGIDVTLFEGLLHTAPPARRAQYVALNTAVANLIAFVAPIAGAALAGLLGIPVVLFLAGVLHFLAAAAMACYVRRTV